MIDKTVKIPNGCYAEMAKYKESIIPNYRGNPFIEALPDLLTDSEVIEKLINYPEYNSSEREMESHYRVHLVNKLFQVFQPLPLTMEIESRIARTIRQGYIARTPFSPEFVSAYNKECKAVGQIECKNNIYNASSSGFTIIGVSGIGKTSAIHHILNLYPQVIVHNCYQSKPLSTYQVLWLQLECTFDGSIKGLIIEFFAKIDNLLGTNYLKRINNQTTDQMISVMNKVVLSFNLGLLVIDEIQHLSLMKSGGSQKMLNFFVNLVNNVGIPIILVGTPKAMGVLSSEFRLCRRGLGIGGDIVCDRLQKDRIWDLLLRGIWNYQWTKNEIKLTEEISDVLYEETQGIPDLLVKLYAITQVYSISTGKEDINPEIIKKVAKDNLKLVQPMIKALKSGSFREIAKYEDIYIPNLDLNDILVRTNENIKANHKAIEQLSIKNSEKVINQNNVTKFQVADKRDDKKDDKKSFNKKIELSKNDIRYLVKEGENKNKQAYEALKEYGYIKDYNF